MRRSCCLITFIICLSVSLGAQTAAFYQTTPDLTQKLKQGSSVTFGSTGSAPKTIPVDDTKTYQQVEGFGASLTDSAAWLIYNKLTEAQRAAAMQLLFDRQNGIALSFLRQPMGASDLALNFYTYDDMPSGQKDPSL
ncbi:MAG TPA: glucosylceramidase, partial [Terriglobales bacterium]